MTIFYPLSRIKLGQTILHGGHEVNTSAVLHDEQDQSIRVVYKKNKHNKVDISYFEAAFGELARLFLPQDCTAKQFLVKDENGEVTGIASELISYPILRREQNPHQFYHIQHIPNQPLLYTPVEEESATALPFYFLNNLGRKFLNDVEKEIQQKRLAINMESLVGVLTSSYTLEEDDLHKGNLGFYIVKRDTTPEIVFFKIDHDLTLADSVMSFRGARFNHWVNGSDAFRITARDLVNFPNISDSQNFYWPTYYRKTSFRGHAYSVDDTHFFKKFAHSPEFNKEKWKCFLKHILIQPQAIEEAMGIHLDSAHPEERAKTALITQSIVARQAKLRAVLFSIPEFRQFIAELKGEELQAIKANLLSQTTNAESKITLSKTLHFYKKLCQNNKFAAGDTPLHAAIRLGDFRYHETCQNFSSHLNHKNAQGETPLDIAVALAKHQSGTLDIRQDARATIAHLIQAGAKETPSFRRLEKASNKSLKKYTERSKYLAQTDHATTEVALRTLLKELGEDHRYCLKMKKQIAVQVVQAFIQKNRDNKQLPALLKNFKDALNGCKNTPPAPELFYIRQLRSQLWIVRVFRGLFGNTSTKKELNKLINPFLTNGYFRSMRFFDIPQESVPFPDSVNLPAAKGP